MHTTRAVILHPSAFRTPWHVAFLVAAGELVKYSALTAAVVIGGTVAVVLALLLALLAAPLCAALLAFVVWRSAAHGARAGGEFPGRARRGKRPLPLRVVRGAGS